MRIDLESNERRQPRFRLALALQGLIIGMKSPPLLAVSYDAAIVTPPLRTYFLRALTASGVWSKGDAELISAYVSDRNRCHF